MTAVLVSVEELRARVGAAESDKDELQQILDGLEASLVRAVNRVKYPFARATSGIVEVHAGTGSAKLWTGYPIGTLTSVTLGRNTASPDETLDVADVDQLVYGGNLLERTDGGKFGKIRAARYVHVTYDSLEDRPEEARKAILSAASAAWQRKGSEAYSKVQELGASVTFAGAGTPGQDVTAPAWDKALIAGLRRYAP